MSTLELIEENSDTCPVESRGVGGVPLLMLGAVGVIAVVGMIYAGSKNEPPQV
jgi:hypothetical protein